MHLLAHCREEASLSGVAQAVVDQVVRLHRDTLEVTGGRAETLEDMTLLIRDLREYRAKEGGGGGGRGAAASTLTGSSARY